MENHSDISRILFKNGLWYMIITRRNGTTYRVSSENYDAIHDYRMEFVEARFKRKTR